MNRERTYGFGQHTRRNLGTRRSRLPRQSELVVNAVVNSVPSHLVDRLMASAIAFLSERDQVLRIDAPVRTCPVEGDLSLIEQTHKKLQGDSEEIRGLLRGHLLGCGGERYRFAVREIVDDFQEEPVELIRERDLVKPAMPPGAITLKTAPEFSDFCLLGVLYSGWFEN
jgi:hypothetical protein